MKKSASLLVLSVALPWVGPAAASPRDDWSKATSAFQAALASGNDAQVGQAASKVVADNSIRAVDFLLKPLRMNPQPGIYWAIISGLSKITDAKAFEAIATEVLKGKIPELRRDLIMALRLSETANAVEPLTRILKEGTPELQVSAMDELVDRGVVGTVAVLIELAEKDSKEERELTRRCFKAIRALVKEEPPGGPATWKAWWEKKSGEVKEDPDAGKSDSRKVGETVIESIRRSRATQFEELKKGNKEDIIVIEGVYDTVQDVLFRLSIPHQSMSLDRMMALSDASLGKCYAIFVNCGSGSGAWPSAGIDRIRKYVAGGGYLCVTDLGMTFVVKQAFPGYLDFGKGTLKNMTTNIVPWKGSTGHPFMKGVIIPSGTALTWAIDDSSACMGIESKKVVPLVEAPALAATRKPTTVASTFTYGGNDKAWQDAVVTGGVYQELGMVGGGTVLCLLSHFGKQRQGEDGFALQNMLINFLIEAKDRSQIREAKKAEKKPGKSP